MKPLAGIDSERFYSFNKAKFEASRNRSKSNLVSVVIYMVWLAPISGFGRVFTTAKNMQKNTWWLRALPFFLVSVLSIAAPTAVLFRFPGVVDIQLGGDGGRITIDGRSQDSSDKF